MSTFIPIGQLSEECDHVYDLLPNRTCTPCLLCNCTRSKLYVNKHHHIFNKDGKCCQKDLVDDTNRQFSVGWQELSEPMKTMLLKQGNEYYDVVCQVKREDMIVKYKAVEPVENSKKKAKI
jgi:hypothetical protein